MTSTSQDSLTETVHRIYAAFGSGDVPGFLDLLSDDELRWESEWENNYAQHPGGPAFFGPHHDKEGVRRFFDLMSANTFHALEVVEVLTGDHVAVARVRLDYTMPSGGRYRDEQLHHWTFGPDGRVVALRHFLDTAKIIAATRGEDTTTS